MNKGEGSEPAEAAGFASRMPRTSSSSPPKMPQLVELRLVLSRAILRGGSSRNLTQEQVARKLKSSQSRVAKMEAGAADVSLDLLFRGFFALGGNLKDLRLAR